MKTLAEQRRDFAGNSLTRMKRLRGIQRFALLLALTEGVILLIAWAGKAYIPALHVDCVPRVIGGIQYVCKQPSVDVPANYDVGWLVATLPDIVLEIAIVVGVSLLITAAVHLSISRVFHRRTTDGADSQGHLDPTAVYLETSARPEPSVPLVQAQLVQGTAENDAVPPERPQRREHRMTITVSSRGILVSGFVLVFLLGAAVGFLARPTTPAEQTQAELHARVQDCVTQFQQTHLWPNSCPPVSPPETEAQLAIEKLCPHGWGSTTESDGSQQAYCTDPSASPTTP